MSNNEILEKIQFENKCRKETLVENVSRFLSVLDSLVKFNTENHYSLNMYSWDFTDRGVQAKTLRWLIENHYIAIHDPRPVWISWKNECYPSRTIEDLRMLVVRGEL
jgi:hypothetical protein